MNTNCSICGHSHVIKNTFASRTNIELDIYLCDNCGHGLQIKNDNYDIYSSGEFTQAALNETSIPSQEKIKALDKKAFRRFKFYKKFFPGIKSALEVGSSIGSFIHLMKLAGVDAEGIEPDASYADFSTGQYGFDQAAVLFENFYPNKTYDLIYSFHVIEHVPDAEFYVRKARTLLNQQGKILIECPSWDLHSYGDVKFTMWEPHLQYFTLSSMYALLSKNGFRVIEINFIGSAVYAVAQKASETTFDQHIFNGYKKRFLRTFRLVKYFPKFPISIKGTNTSQLLLQYLLAKNNNRTLKEVISLATFSIININYLKKEKGSRSNKASHVSYYSGWENAGDTVLSKCVRTVFNKSFSNGWNLIKLTDPVTEKNIEKINQSAYLLIGGGGVLLPDSNPNSISGWQWAIDPTFWEKIKVPVIVFGIGYNFFKGQKNSELFIDNLEKLVTRADFFSLRNHGSIKKVCELLPENLHDKIAYQPCPTTIIRNLCPHLKTKKDGNLIGINIAFDRYERRFGKNIYTILDQIALAIKQIEELGFQIINVCHLENDSKFEISLDQRSVKYQTVNLQFKLPNEVYDFYNKVALMFGMRGHAQMIPFGLNTKIISLGTHDKIRYFLEDIDALDWYINVNQAPESLSIEMLEKFNQQMFLEKNETEKRLVEQQELLADITQENMNKIFTVINDHMSQ